MFVRFHDRTIYTWSETEIVGVDDQAAHRASLTGMCDDAPGVVSACRDGLGTRLAPVSSNYAKCKQVQA